MVDRDQTSMPERGGFSPERGDLSPRTSKQPQGLYLMVFNRTFKLVSTHSGERVKLIAIPSAFPAGDDASCSLPRCTR